MFALFGVVCGGIILAAALNLNELGTTMSQVTMLGVVYINPIFRLFEFMLGICCGLLWKQLKGHSTSIGIMTVLEVATMAVMLAYTCSIGPLTEGMRAQGPYLQAIHMWLLHSGNCLFIAAFILTCAFQRGLVSKFLSQKPFVWLGELSYSMYLIHATFLIFFERNQVALGGAHPLVCLGVFTALLFISSHLTFDFVEKPMRDLLNGTARKKQSATKFVNHKTIIILVEVAILVGASLWIKDRIKQHNREHSRAQREQRMLNRTKPGVGI